MKVRSTQTELMDDLDYDGRDLISTLKELDFINKWLGGEKISMQAFKRLVGEGRLNSVVDLGCGSGHILSLLKKQYPKIACMGIDANPAICDYARSVNPSIEFEELNIFDYRFASRKFDVIHCCLFLHHFSEKQLIGLFKTFKSQAQRGIIVNDLHRHSLAYWSISLLTKLFSRSRLVKHDARLSVRRGFKRAELENILFEAGISDYELHWKWAFRWQLIIKTQKNHS